MAGQGGDEQFPSFPQKAAKSEEQPQACGTLSNPISYFPSKLQENVTVHLMEQQIQTSTCHSLRDSSKPYIGRKPLLFTPYKHLLLQRH